MLQGYELNLRDYWFVFQKRKWLILFVFSLIFITVVIYTHLQPRLYRVTALIKIEPVEELGAIFPRPQRMYRIDLSDYREQIKSIPVIREALKKSGILGKDISEEKMVEAVRTVMDNLSVGVVERTHMLQIEMISEEPKKAAEIVNNIIAVFRAEIAKQKKLQVASVKQFIESQLEKVSIRLRESESRVKALTMQGIGGTVSSIMQIIADLESRRSELLTKFTALHPDIVKIDEQIASLREELKNLPKEEFEYNNLQRDARINEKLYTLLRERLQETQIKESEKIDNVLLVNAALPADTPFSPNIPANYAMGILLGIAIGILLALIVEHFDTSVGRVEELEIVTGIKVIGLVPYLGPKSKGFKGAFRENKNAFGKEINEEEKIERLKRLLIVNHKESSIFLEAFRILCANVQILFGVKGKIKKKSILITSSNPQEGKSVIAANMGAIMAQMGYKTLLVDLDLRRSTLHKMFGLADKKGGITDILAEKISSESAVKTATDLFLGDMNQDDLLKNPWVDNLHIITAGTTVPNVPYLLNTNKMAELLETAKQRYDVIIMDSSPILAVSDTSLLSRYADAILLVYRAGYTSRIALQRATTQIENVRGKEALKGIILNNVTPEVKMDTYYYYHRKSYYFDKKSEEVYPSPAKNV